MDANPASESDRELITQIRSGNEQAFELLVRRNYDDLLKYLTSKTHSLQDSEDIMQTVFLRIWRGRESLTIDTTIRAYLFAAARNQLLNHFRSEKRANNAAVSYSSELSSKNDGITTAEQNEIVRSVNSALNVSHRFSASLESLLQIQNLTDFYQSDISVTIPTTGRQTRLGARIRW